MTADPMTITVATLLTDLAAIERANYDTPDEVRMHPGTWASLLSTSDIRAFMVFDSRGDNFAGIKVVKDASVAGVEFYRQGRRLRIPS